MSNKLRNYTQVLISKNLLEAIMRVVLASMFLLTFGTMARLRGGVASRERLLAPTDCVRMI